jgi:hypothetical protein
MLKQIHFRLGEQLFVDIAQNRVGTRITLLRMLGH